MTKSKKSGIEVSLSSSSSQMNLVLTKNGENFTSDAIELGDVLTIEYALTENLNKMFQSTLKECYVTDDIKFVPLIGKS